MSGLSILSIFFKCTSTSLFTGSYYSLKFETFHEYFRQHSLKSGGTKDRFRWVKVPGTVLIERLEMLPCLRQYIASVFFPA